MTPGVAGVLFDKDGTLFDFAATWNSWAAEVIETLSGGAANRRHRLASVLRYDLDRRVFAPDSPVIAGTNREVAELLAGALPDRPVAVIERFLIESAETAPLAEAVPLVPFLAELVAMDLRLGVMTNDAEAAARAHLQSAGVAGMFDFIAGSDSGFGGKPAPEPLWAFADQVGLASEQVVMVGDSLHDLTAGRAAGMRTVGVLTGMATEDDLAPHADVVLPDIGFLPEWIREG